MQRLMFQCIQRNLLSCKRADVMPSHMRQKATAPGNFRFRSSVGRIIRKQYLCSRTRYTSVPSKTGNASVFYGIMDIDQYTDPNHCAVSTQLSRFSCIHVLKFHGIASVQLVG